MKLQTRNDGENEQNKIKAPKKMKKPTSVSSESSSSSSLILALPLAILLDIFFRLPINAILNCKLVCKSWLHLLFSNPTFSLNYKSPFTTFLIPRHIYNDHNNSSSYYEFRLFEISEDHPNTTFRTTVKPRRLPGWSLSSDNCSLSFVGACNRLICLYLSKGWFHTVYVCNPLTNECVATLPKRRIDRHNFALVRYRFGFCPSTNKYKVLRIIDGQDDDINDKLRGEIFTVGLDARWRCLSEAFMDTSFYSEWFASYGAFHWFVTGEEDTTSIRTFHLRDEKIGQTLPPLGLVLDSCTMMLATLSNRLCLIDCSDPSDQISIWTLNNQYTGRIEDEEVSWTKDVVVLSCFATDLGLTDEYSALYGSYLPLAKLQNGDILLLCSFEGQNILISYNIKDRVCCKIEAPEITINSDAMTFNPSFLSSGEVGINDRRSECIE